MKLNKESIYKLESVENIREFLTGGNAIMTLESKKTGNWFTYRIKRAKKDDENSPLFVSVLTGQNNESAYTYMGTIFTNHKFNFTLTKNSKITEDALSYKAFNIFFNLLMKDKVHGDMNIFHRGVCARCGRTLTTPESLINGFGPECSKIKNKTKN